MNKARALSIINPILALLLVSQATTGLFHEMLPHEFFEAIHPGVEIALVIVAAIHVFLNWQWIKARSWKATKKNA